MDSTDERRGEGLLDDQLQVVVGVPLVVRAEVADVLGRTERSPRLLKQEDRVVAVRR